MDNDWNLAVWPDGTWCYKDELHEMTHMSDDFQRIYWPPPDHLPTINWLLDYAALQLNPSLRIK